MTTMIGEIGLQQVPASAEERRKIRAQIDSLPLDESIHRHQLEELAKSVVDDPHFLAWTMVLIGSRAWRDRVLSVPINRRLLLLPHCMRNAKRCPAKYNPDGLLCENCGACELGHLKSLAESLGYHVLIAEGSPVVMQWILSGRADAILGIGCLRSLERAFDKLQLAGIPAMAIPLHASNCCDSQTDLDWVIEMIQTPYQPAKKKIGTKNQPTWIHLLRGAAKLFETKLLDQNNPKSKDPIDKTCQIAFDFIFRGGKYYRPFIVMATYDALTGSKGTRWDGNKYVAKFPDWVKGTAAAIEYFHKASLIHDDIEDDDQFRYGLPTLHRLYGTPMAINVGDYILGWGYQLIAELHNQIPASASIPKNEIIVEMLACLSVAHRRLCEGQGAELDWKSRYPDSPTTPEILKIYVYKTSPAFAAAIETGVLLAVASGNIDMSFYRNAKKILDHFSTHLGVAYQIKNDLDDWLDDRMNKRIAGGDALQNRPTLIRAMAEFEFDTKNDSVQKIYDKLQKAGIFNKARQLIGRYALKAREVAEEIDHVPLRQLLLHFVETIAEI